MEIHLFHPNTPPVQVICWGFTYLWECCVCEYCNHLFYYISRISQLEFLNEDEVQSLRELQRVYRRENKPIRPRETVQSPAKGRNTLIVILRRLNVYVFVTTDLLWWYPSLNHMDDLFSNKQQQYEKNKQLIYLHMYKEIINHSSQRASVISCIVHVFCTTLHHAPPRSTKIYPVPSG